MNSLRGKIRHATRQSGLSRFFAEKHEWFNREIVQAVSPNWSKIAELIAEAGVLDRNGNPPSAEAVRKAASRVRRLPAPIPAPTVTAPIPSAPSTTPPPDTDFIAVLQEIKNKRTIK